MVRRRRDGVRSKEKRLRAFSRLVKVEGIL